MLHTHTEHEGMCMCVCVYIYIYVYITSCYASGCECITHGQPIPYYINIHALSNIFRYSSCNSLTPSPKHGSYNVHNYTLTHCISRCMLINQINTNNSKLFLLVSYENTIQRMLASLRLRISCLRFCYLEMQKFKQV